MAQTAACPAHVTLCQADLRFRSTLTRLDQALLRARLAVLAGWNCAKPGSSTWDGRTACEVLIPLTLNLPENPAGRRGTADRRNGNAVARLVPAQVPPLTRCFRQRGCALRQLFGTLGDSTTS